MNHQTEAILKEAAAAINDEGVFTTDQINALATMIDRIGKAISKESYCLGSGISYNR